MDDTSPLPIFIFLIIVKYLYTFQVLFGSIDFYEGEIYVCLKILRPNQEVTRKKRKYVQYYTGFSVIFICLGVMSL
jgi:hypothetical protein